MKVNKILLGLSYAAAVPFLFLSSSSLAQTGNPGLDAELQRSTTLEGEVIDEIERSEPDRVQAQKKYQQLTYECNAGNQQACVEKNNWDRHRESILRRWEQDTTGQ